MTDFLKLQSEKTIEKPQEINNDESLPDLNVDSWTESPVNTTDNKKSVEKKEKTGF
jgi:hypothetical protein